MNCQRECPIDFGDTAYLRAFAKDDDGDSLRFNWVQSVGAAVTLSNPNYAYPSFTIGSQHAEQRLSFYAQASDGKSTVNSHQRNRPNGGGSIAEWTPRENTPVTIDITDEVMHTLALGDISLSGDLDFTGTHGDLAAFEMAES